MQITKRQLLQIIKEESEALKGTTGKQTLNESWFIRIMTAIGALPPDPTEKQIKDIEAKINSMSAEEQLEFLKKMEGGGMVQDTGPDPLAGGEAIGRAGFQAGKHFPGTGTVQKSSDEPEGEPIEESIRKIVRRHALKESVRTVVRKHTTKRRRPSRRG